MRHLTWPKLREIIENEDDEKLMRALKADLLPPAISAIRAGLRPKCPTCKRGAQRWAVRNVLEMAKLVGVQPQVVLAMFAKVGVSTEDELRTLVESGRRMEQLRDGDIDAAAMADDFVEGLKLIFARAPDLRASVMARLSSGVVEVPANGNGNGNGAHE